MKVELKKLKTYPRMSEETVAFNADLWIDGQYAADASNSGHGEPVLLRFDDRELEQRFYDWCKQQPGEEFNGIPLPMDSDFYISRMVEDAEFVKKSKGKVLYRLQGMQDGEWQQIGWKRGYKPTAQDFERVVAEIKAKNANLTGLLINGERAI